jgi:hypothetical protein
MGDSVPQKHKIDNDMKIKSILILAAGMLVTASFAAARPAQTGRCGQPRGTCGNECDGSGFMNQGRGNGNGQGQGQGFRRGPRDGSGNGGGDRQRRRDGSGGNCPKGT